jgi:hypothetical protein
MVPENVPSFCARRVSKAVGCRRRARPEWARGSVILHCWDYGSGFRSLLADLMEVRTGAKAVS